jgi:hypothetical protein
LQKQNPLTQTGALRYNAPQTSTMKTESDRLGNGTNVRFDAATRRRVERLAKQHGLKKADLIRNALSHKLAEWEREGVKFAPTAV